MTKDCNECIMYLTMRAPIFSQIRHSSGRLKALERYSSSSRSSNNNNSSNGSKSFRNVKKQNEWLLDNVFDRETGELKFCQKCICLYLNVVIYVQYLSYNNSQIFIMLLTCVVYFILYA